MAQKTTSSIKTSKILIGAAGTDLNTLTIGSNATNTSFVFLSGNKVVFEFGTLQQTAPVVNPETGTSTVTTTGSDGTVTVTTTDNTSGQVIETVQTTTEGSVTTVTTTSNSLGTVTQVATDATTGTVTTTLYDLSYTFIQSTAVTAPDATTGYVTTTVTVADGSATETVTDPNNNHQQIIQTLISAPSSSDGSYTRTTTNADGSVAVELYDSTDTLIRTTTTSAPDANGNTTVTVTDHTVSTIQDETTVVTDGSGVEYVDRVLFQELTAGSTSYGSNGITVGGKTYVTKNVGRIQTDTNGKNYLEMNNGQFEVTDFVSDATLLSHTFYYVVRPQDTSGSIYRFLWDPATHAFNVEINFNPNKTGFYPLVWSTTTSPTYLISTTFNPQDSYTIVAMRLQYVSAINYKADIRFVAKPGASYITAGSTQERTVSSPTVLGKKFYFGSNSSSTNNFKLYEFGVMDRYLDAASFDALVESLKTKYYGA